MKKVHHEDTIVRTFILFVQSARAVLKYADAILYREARLSVVKLVALQALSTSEKGMMPSELADWTHTERHNITTLVKRLEKDGLVKAEINSSNRRSVKITLTDGGYERLSHAIPVARSIINQVMASVTEGDSVNLEKMLEVLRQNAHQGLEGQSSRFHQRLG